MSNAKQVYQAFLDYLKSRDYKSIETDEEKLLINLTVRGEDLPQPTYIHVMEDREVVGILSPIPARIPEDKRVDGAIAVAVTNYGMINGSFDYDISDGEIRFRTAQSFAGAVLNEEQIDYLLKVTFFTTDKYNDRFFMLSKGMMTLEEFIKKENG